MNGRNLFLQTLPPLLLALAAGCAAGPAQDRGWVSDEIAERSGRMPGPPVTPGEVTLPTGVGLTDGLELDEAVATALWNNARFQADLARLGLARADLLQAGMISNPVFSLFFPVGPKGLEAKMILPLAEFVQRPGKVAAARLDAERVAEDLVQNGLGLVRDVETAYFALAAARQARSQAEEGAAAQAELARIAQARLAAGDISEQECSRTVAASLQARDGLAVRRREAALRQHELAALMGLGAGAPSLEPVTAVAAAEAPAPLEELQAVALAARPDLHAAELGVEAAGRRVGLERARILELMAIIDSKDKGEPQLTTGPGLQVGLPILNQNRAGTTRAHAELETAAYTYEATRQQVLLEVASAWEAYRSVLERHTRWRQETLPALEGAYRQAVQAEASGETSPQAVQEALVQLTSARLHLADLEAELGQASARLDFSVGTRTVSRSEVEDNDGGLS